MGRTTHRSARRGPSQPGLARRHRHRRAAPAHRARWAPRPLARSVPRATTTVAAAPSNPPGNATTIPWLPENPATRARTAGCPCPRALSRSAAALEVESCRRCANGHGTPVGRDGGERGRDARGQRVPVDLATPGVPGRPSPRAKRRGKHERLAVGWRPLPRVRTDQPLLRRSTAASVRSSPSSSVTGATAAAAPASPGKTAGAGSRPTLSAKTSRAEPGAEKCTAVVSGTTLIWPL